MHFKRLFSSVNFFILPSSFVICSFFFYFYFIFLALSSATCVFCLGIVTIFSFILFKQLLLYLCHFDSFLFSHSLFCTESAFALNCTKEKKTETTVKCSNQNFFKNVIIFADKNKKK